MWISVQGKVSEVDESHAAALNIDLAVCGITANHLRSFDVEVSDQRFVIDGRIATAAGVSAGVDLALELARRLAGDQAACRIGLQIEYDPSPPMDCGSPARAPADVVSRLRQEARRYR